jgi:hypothetical protein
MFSRVECSAASSPEVLLHAQCARMESASGLDLPALTHVEDPTQPVGHYLREDEEIFASHVSHDVVPGPETYEQGLASHRFFVGQLKNLFDGHDGQVWTDIKSQDVIMSTDYSGSGSAEVSMTLLQDSCFALVLTTCGSLSSLHAHSITHAHMHAHSHAHADDTHTARARTHTRTRTHTHTHTRHTPSQMHAVVHW